MRYALIEHRSKKSLNSMNSVSSPVSKLSPLDRFLRLFSKTQPGEGKSVLLLFCMAFLFLFASYLLKPVRETLILTNGDAESRSYAIAAQAVLLLFIIPVYGLLYKKTNKQELMRWIICVSIVFILFFYLILYVVEASAVFSFYIWLGIFGVLILAQFWGFASDLYNEETGERLFATIALGASAGAWVGSAFSKNLMSIIGPSGLMLLACAVLLITYYIVPWVERLIPTSSRASYSPEKKQVDRHFLSSFRLVAKSPYLMLIATFVVLFNWISSTSDFVLSAWVVTLAEQAVANGTAVDKAIYIGEFYSDFFLLVSLVGFIIQALFVSRIISAVGVSVAIVILPAIMLIGYTGVYFFPVFTLFYIFKISENSLGYSLQNTLRQILFLPTSKQVKYEGRTLIETFFWRAGDVLQGVGVYIGYNVIQLNWSYFLLLNVVLTTIVVLLVIGIGFYYRNLMRG